MTKQEKKEQLFREMVADLLKEKKKDEPKDKKY